LGKLALIVLTQNRNEEPSSSNDLAAQIWAQFSLGSLSATWKVEKITVLEDS
jgi:hypothetical protein